MKRKVDTEDDAKPAKKPRKDKDQSHHKHKSKDKRKEKHRDKDEKRHKESKSQMESPEKVSPVTETDTKLSKQDGPVKSSDERETTHFVKEHSVNGNGAKTKAITDNLKLDKPSDCIKLKIEKNTPKKFHISNFTLGSSEKKDKSLKKKHKEKDKERKDKSTKKPCSSKESHSGKMISTLYGNQSLELKHSVPEEQKRSKPPVKLERKISRQKSEAEQMLYHAVLKSKQKKDLMNEPYMPEYHEVKRYISKDITGEFQQLLHIEVHPNGGGLVLHSYQDEVDELPSDKQKDFVNEYMRLAFLEDDQQSAYFIMAIIHDSAKPLPDLLDYLAEKHPSMVTKMGTLGKSDIETMHMSDVKDKIYNSYCCGTYRAGPLLQLSLVGLAQEEVYIYIYTLFCTVSCL